MRMIKKLPAALLLLLSWLASAGSITYNQDGFPILMNGSSTDSADNLNADDGIYYNILPASAWGTPVVNLRVQCKSLSCTEGGVPEASNCNCDSINTSDDSYPGKGGKLKTKGSGTAGQVVVEENLSATTAEVPDGAAITSVVATIEFRVSEDNNTACFLDVWNGTTFIENALTCYTEDTMVHINVTPALDTVAKLRTAMLRMRYVGVKKGDSLFLDLLNLTVNYTPQEYRISVTHNSTANVVVPAGHQLIRSEAHIVAKSNNSTAPTYTASWYFGGGYVTTGCSAAATIGNGTDTDITCNDTATPASAIANNRMSVRLSTSAAVQPFQLSEDYVYFRIWFPNLTTTTISPATDPAPQAGSYFQVNCTSGVDADFGIDDATFYLLFSNDTGATWSTLATNSTGLRLNSTTPTNPYTSQSISAGGTTTKSWYVDTVAEGSYMLKCVTNSTSAGEQNSTALIANVAPVAQPQVSAGKANYSGCTTVYYRIRLFDNSDFLVNANFDLNVTDSTNATRQSLPGAYPNNGTGVYTGYVLLNYTEPAGQWLIRAIARQAAGVRSFNVTT